MVLTSIEVIKAMDLIMVLTQFEGDFSAKDDSQFNTLKVGQC